MNKLGSRSDGNFETSISNPDVFEMAGRKKKQEMVGRQCTQGPKEPQIFPFAFTSIFADEGEGHQCICCCNFRF